MPTRTALSATHAPLRRRFHTRWLRTAVVLAFGLLAGCAARHPDVSRPDPARVRAHVRQLLPATVADRDGWASDITAAFAAQGLDPSTRNLCAVLAVAAQESSFKAEPVVPGLGRIARAEIDRRAAAHHIPQLLVRAALAVHSPDGRSYADRIQALHTEREMSLLYEDMIGTIPLGRTLFGGANPVHTGGPMQVSVDFAEGYADRHAYPYPIDGSIRHEVFSRRGGLYFGIAHLLDYPARYPQMLYRFADYNAGFYASRNAAFQQAVVRASGIPLTLDGDLVSYRSGAISHTETAVRTLATQLDLSEGEIRDALEQGERPDFVDTDLYKRTFALADRLARQKMPREILPRITLESPKITRRLTTAWFAKRVDGRYQACLGANR